MSGSAKASSWRQRIDGTGRIGPPVANRIAAIGLSRLPVRRLLVPLIVAAVSAFWAPAATIAADRTAPISTAYCIDCVPFQFQDENGEPAGLIIDLWRLWSERTGIEIDFRPGHWDETLRMVRDGEVEAHAGLFYNEQRARYLEYGSYLTNTETHYFIKKGLPPVDNVEDLAAYRVGVLAGDYVEGFLAERLPEGTIIGFESYDAIMDALQDGQLQVFAADSPTGIYHLQKAGLGFGFEYPEQTPLYQTDWLVAAAKGNKELIEIFNLGLATISEDERRAIERRWVAVEAKGFELSRRDISILAAILAAVVVVGILVWNFSLKRQIASRTQELKADIAKREEVEAALHESEERHAVAIEGANDGLWDWNIESGEIHVSPHARELLGLERSAATTTPEDWNARVHPDDFDRRLEIEEAHLRGETEFYTDEYRVRGADGTYHWVLDRGACLRDAEGRAYRMAGSLGDITDRKQGELFLRTIVDSLPAALNIRDTEGRFALINERLAGYYGIDAATAMGTFSNEAFPGFDFEEEQFSQVLSTGTPIVDSEIRYEAPDGSDEYWLTTRQPIHGDAGELQYVLTVSYEITDRKRAEEELRSANEASAAARTRLLDAIESLPAAFVLYDSDDRLLLCNGRFRDLFGYSKEEAVAGVSHGELFKLDVERGNVAVDIDEHDYFKQRVTLRREREGMSEVQFTNGRWLQMHERTTSEGGLVSVQVDITDRKRAERDLAETEARLRVALDNMPGGIRLVDKDRRYVFFNSQYSELYEFPEGLLEVGGSNRVYQAKRGEPDRTSIRVESPDQ